MSYKFTDTSNQIIELSGQTMLHPGDAVEWGAASYKGIVRALIPANIRPSECYPWMFELKSNRADMNIVLSSNFEMPHHRALVQSGNRWIAVFVNRLKPIDQ